MSSSRQQDCFCCLFLGFIEVIVNVFDQFVELKSNLVLFIFPTTSYLMPISMGFKVTFESSYTYGTKSFRLLSCKKQLSYTADANNDVS